MLNKPMFKIECTPEHAHRFADWIETRGGVATWKSVDLGNPSASWSTPALDAEGKPTAKPTWQSGNVPEIITNMDEVGVFTDVLFKAFPVGLKRGSGMSFCLTDGAQRKLDKYLAQCEEKHGSAHYKRGVLDIDGASMGVYYVDKIISLTEYCSGQAVAA